MKSHDSSKQSASEAICGYRAFDEAAPAMFPDGACIERAFGADAASGFARVVSAIDDLAQARYDDVCFTPDNSREQRQA